MLTGGKQERNRRAGTENVAGHRRPGRRGRARRRQARRPRPRGWRRCATGSRAASSPACRGTAVNGAPRPRACRTRPTSASTASRPSRCSSRSTSRASPSRPDRPARRARSSRRTCCGDGLPGAPDAELAALQPRAPARPTPRSTRVLGTCCRALVDKLRALAGRPARGSRPSAERQHPCAIVVAMSGGVDSSVAAALLAEQGHEVIGLSMQLYDQREGQVRFGTLLHARRPARRAARRRRARHPALHRQLRARSSTSTVVANFVREYAAGRTPIPCAHCNSDLKFATLAERAARARRRRRRHRPLRARRARRGRRAGTGCCAGVDPAKDQAYFLFSLDAGAAGARAVPGRRPGRRPTVRAYAARARPAGRRQARQPGDLLRARRRLRRRSSSASGAQRAAAARSRTTAARVARPPRRRPPLHRRPAQGPRALGAAEPLYVVGIDAGRADGGRRPERGARARAR